MDEDVKMYVIFNYLKCIYDYLLEDNVKLIIQNLKKGELDTFKKNILEKIQSSIWYLNDKSYGFENSEIYNIYKIISKYL